MSSSSATFSQLRLAAFESRRAEELARLIDKFDGVAYVSPSLRETPIERNQEAVDFALRLMTGQIDVVILLTGVGVRFFLEQTAGHCERGRLLDSLRDIHLVVRGPKPLAVLRELGVKPSHVVPEPNTWREILALIDRELPVAHARVAVLEYGAPNVSLVAGLEARGAAVETVKVYRWDLPVDLDPLRANVRRLASREVDAALFTSAQQVEHLLQVAEQLELRQETLAGLGEIVVASVGPTTSEALRSQGIGVDFEPSHAKLGQLVAEFAAVAADLRSAKRRIHAQLAAPRREPAGAPPAWHDSPFLKACRREAVPYTPVWLMRQAGRYMAEYRQVRAQTGFLELCRNPQLCSEVMCVAVEKLGVDAAIIFSDLLPILEPMGMDLEFTPGDGPQIHNPVREAGDVDRVIELESTSALHYVFETVAQTRRDLPERIPLIGFAGAPFTLASYAIEGGSSRSFLHAKTLMYRQPDAWNELLGRLARSVARYLNAQIAAGAQAVQLFDSWVGCLGPDDYRRYVLPHMKTLVAALEPGTPLIQFATGNPALLPLLAEAGGEVIGVDWRIGLDDAWTAVGHDRAVQGNLDPAALLADRRTLEQRAADVLAAAAGRPGHIFNLGHGVLPQTSVDNARALVDFVHEASTRRGT